MQHKLSLFGILSKKLVQTDTTVHPIYINEYIMKTTLDITQYTLTAPPNYGLQNEHQVELPQSNSFN